MSGSITLFSNSIPYYNLFINIGTVLGTIVFVFICWKKSKSIERTISAGVLGYALLVWGFFSSNLLRGLYYGKEIDFPGVFIKNYGGHFLGRVLLVVWLFPVLYILLFQKEKREWVKYLEMMCFFLTIQHIFNRIACLSNGCCGGKEIHGAGTFEYPTQLFEIVSMIILLGVCIYLYKNGRRIVILFQVWFSVTIFLSELMMENDGVVYYLGLNVIQYAALILCMNAVLMRKLILSK